MIFEIIRGGGETDWVGKEWAGLLFPRGKNGPAHSFPGEKTDWGEIPACYTGNTKFVNRGLSSCDVIALDHLDASCEFDHSDWLVDKTIKVRRDI